MQEFRRPSDPSLQRLGSFTEDSSPRTYGSPSVSRNASINSRDGSNHNEAILKAQNFELRRELASSRQAAQDAQRDLERRQSLIRAAAGEARKEVLSLRSENQQLSSDLTNTRQEVQDLEASIQELVLKLEGVNEGAANDGDEDLKNRLNDMEMEMEELRSNERVSLATKEAWRAQIAELVKQIESYKDQLATLQKSPHWAAEDVQDTPSQELEALRRDYSDALTQVEALQNELDVTIEESSQDRLSAAARILELENRLAELQQAPNPHQENGGHIRHETDDQSSEEGPGLKALLSPLRGRKGNGSPQRVFNRKRMLTSSSADSLETSSSPGLLKSVHNVSELQADSSEAALRNHLNIAGNYLNDLSSRLQDSSFDLSSSEGLEDGTKALHTDLIAFKEAVAAFEERMSRQQGRETAMSSAQSLHTEAGVLSAQKVEKKCFQRATAIRLAGGLILAPAIVAAALFLPMRRKLQGV